jgi:hypothetical protein
MYVVVLWDVMHARVVGKTKRFEENLLPSSGVKACLNMGDANLFEMLLAFCKLQRGRVFIYCDVFDWRPSLLGNRS